MLIDETNVVVRIGRRQTPAPASAFASVTDFHPTFGDDFVEAILAEGSGQHIELALWLSYQGVKLETKQALKVVKLRIRPGLSLLLPQFLPLRPRPHNLSTTFTFDIKTTQKIDRPCTSNWKTSSPRNPCTAAIS